TRRACELLHWTRHPGRHHKRKHEAEGDGEGTKRDAAPPDAADQRRELTAGAADQQDTQHGAVTSGEWKRVDRFRPVRPLDRLLCFLTTLHDARDERFERRRFRRLITSGDQLPARDFWLQVLIK